MPRMTSKNRTLALPVLSVLLLLTLGACGGASGPGADPAPSTSPSASPAGDVLVTFARQGGLAGLDDRLTVRADGSYTLARSGLSPRPGRLAPEDLARLRQVLDAARLAHIPSPTGNPPVADGFTYRIRYGEREVLARDGDLPEELRPAIEVLNEILARQE
jgi:hypothetical protein